VGFRGPRCDGSFGFDDLCYICGRYYLLTIKADGKGAVMNKWRFRENFEVQFFQNHGTTWSVGLNFFRLDFRAGLAYNSYNLAIGLCKYTVVFRFKHHLKGAM